MCCGQQTVHARATALGLKFRDRSQWTEVEDAVLRDRFPEELTADIARDLGRTKCQIYNRAHLLGLTKSSAFYERERQRQAIRARTNPGMRASQFRKGLVPANKGVKRPPGWSPGRMAETQFKKGQMSGQAQHNYVPIGTERISKDGYLERKVTDEHPVPARRWVAVHRLVWEAAHGPIPDGHKVAFRPGQKTAVSAEITLDRLELVSDAEMMRRNTVHNLPKPLAEAIQLRGALVRRIRKQERRENGQD
nr:HNH endonuclease signature motif containing protein [Dyella lutea]